MLTLSDPKEIILAIIKEKDSGTQRMLFGFYQNKLSRAQIDYVKQKLTPPLLVEAQKQMGGRILWYEDENEEIQDNIRRSALGLSEENRDYAEGEHCVCGGRLYHSTIPCPEQKPGCPVIHYGYVCENCGRIYQ